jgi:hypothetical protein
MSINVLFMSFLPVESAVCARSTTDYAITSYPIIFNPTVFTNVLPCPILSCHVFSCLKMSCLYLLNGRVALNRQQSTKLLRGFQLQRGVVREDVGSVLGDHGRTGGHGTASGGPRADVIGTRHLAAMAVGNGGLWVGGWCVGGGGVTI